MPSYETALICAPLPRHDGCGAAARRLVAERLADELPAPALADLKIVVTELVNNAYVHGEGAIELRVSRVDGRLRLEVIDEGEGAAIAINEQPSDDGGRGLQIVDAVSATWGAFEGTTHVWAELEI